MGLRRLLPLLAPALLLLALWVRPFPPAEAQGVGLFQRADCSTIASAVVGQTFCFDTTTNQLKAYTGSAWRAVTPAPTTAQTFNYDGTTYLTSPQGFLTNNGGGVAAVAFSAVGQTGTGFYWPALNTLAAATNGVKSWGISSAGVMVSGDDGGNPIDNTFGHMEANINVASAPGGFVCVNAAARALNVGCTPVSAYAGGTQLGNLIFQALDASTSNVKLTLGLNTTAGVTNPILTAVKDGSTQGTAFFRIGTGTAVNALEVANTLGPVVKLIDQNAAASAGQLAFTSAGGTGYISTTGGLGALVFRSNDVEKWRMETDGGLTVNSPTGGSKGAGTVNAQVAYYANNNQFMNASGTVINASFLFANLNLVLTANGMQVYCSDCTIAATCAGGGTGAMAKRLAAVMVCN